MVYGLRSPIPASGIIARSGYRYADTVDLVGLAVGDLGFPLLPISSPYGVVVACPLVDGRSDAGRYATRGDGLDMDGGQAMD